MKATSGLFNLVSNFGKIWSARWQYRVQYTDLIMNKNIYNQTHGITYASVYTSSATKLLLIEVNVYLKNAIRAKGRVLLFLSTYTQNIGFGGLDVACWPLVPEFAGSNPAEAVEFIKG
jgi:hypothetical protein